MDKSKIVMYNNGKESTSVSDTLLSQNWKEKNKDSMRYAGDSAKKSIDAGLKEALDFMRDADESLLTILTTRNWQGKLQWN